MPGSPPRALLPLAIHKSTTFRRSSRFRGALRDARMPIGLPALMHVTLLSSHLTSVFDHVFRHPVGSTRVVVCSGVIPPGKSIECIEDLCVKGVPDRRHWYSQRPDQRLHALRGGTRPVFGSTSWDDSMSAGMPNSLFHVDGSLVKTVRFFSLQQNLSREGSHGSVRSEHRKTSLRRPSGLRDRRLDRVDASSSPQRDGLRP